jgi:hypothetical protein
MQGNRHTQVPRPRPSAGSSTMAKPIPKHDDYCLNGKHSIGMIATSGLKGSRFPSGKSRFTRSRMTPKRAHNTAQNRTKELTGCISVCYILSCLHKTAFSLCRRDFFCATPIFCAKFVHRCAGFVQTGHFLCRCGMPLFTGVPEDLCTVVQCCAAFYTRTRTRIKSRRHQR